MCRQFLQSRRQIIRLESKRPWLGLECNAPVLVDQIPIRPSIGVIFAPYRTLKIGDYRPRQKKALGRLSDVIGVISNREFAVMHSNDVKTIPVVFGVPALQNTELANAIDAGVLPKIDQENMATIALDGMGDLLTRLAHINPLRIRGEIGRFHHIFVVGLDERYSDKRNNQNVIKGSHVLGV